MKIALIPIDNRPVCYDLIRDTANIDRDLELFLPDKNLLGGLRSVADVDGLLKWLEKLDKMDAIVISLDTIAYGGLISSRRSKETGDEIRARLEKVKSFLKKGTKVYACSSIMRISNNNVNEEEKEYWDTYGTQIFEYSYTFHKEGQEITEVPSNIISDYLATRQRNFQINKMYIEWFEEGLFDTLVFSKDDCAEFGFNVLESEILKRIINEKESAKELSDSEKSASKKSILIKTGADEIPLALFARAVSEFNNASPKIFPKFLAPDNIYPHKYLISNYEDISVEQSVKAQIELAGGEFATYGTSSEEQADMLLLVNNFEEKQGEIVMGVKTQPFSGKLDIPEKPYLIADVRYANGADNKFISELFKKKFNFNNFYGYSAWNTTANTLGSLLCAGIVRFFAKDYNQDAFKKLQMIRFLDDWGYQANVRQFLKLPINKKPGTENRPDVRKLAKLMQPYEKKLNKILEINPKFKYSFPWKRFFEVGINIK